MSKRWWLLLLFAALFIGQAYPAGAAYWLYRPSQAATILGQKVAGLGDLRRISGEQRALVSGLDTSSVQPDFVYHAQSFPDDPDYPLQWNFSAINLPAAWAADSIDPTGGGDPRVIVAVLDTGLATNAPDLSGLHLWTNSGEIPGDGIDNDHDGFIDDVHGWDFFNNDSSPADDNGHGTHVTGTIAETTNNTVAAAGIAYNTTIMPLKVLDAAGNGSTSTIASAIAYAVSHGANIINLSLGGNQDDPILHQAIQSAANQGVLVVAAAGNSSSATLDYPAAYSEVLSVSATQVDNTRPSYANYGTGLDIMAPGGNSTLDQNHDGYVDGIYQQTCSTPACTSFSTRPFEGTSQATAHISGVAALLAACGVPIGQIRSTLMSTATDLGPAGVDIGYGAGLVNAGAAMQSTNCQTTPPAAPGNIEVHPASGIAATLSANNVYAYRQPEFDWTGPSGDAFQVSWQNGSQPPLVLQQVTPKFIPTLTTDGTYTFSVKTQDSLGQLSSSTTVTYQFRHAAIAVASTNQVRLYTDAFKKIRQLTLPATQSGIGGGITENNNGDRLLVSMNGNTSTVALMTTRGLITQNLQPFGKSFSGGITSAVVRSSQSPTVVAVATASRGAEIRTYDASGHALARQLIYQTYRGGLNLAAGDIGGDGQDELVVGQVSGPEIRVYRADLQRLSVITPLGKKYQGGWTVAVGDYNGDGHQDIVAISQGAQGRRPVYILTLHGAVLTKWTLSTTPYNGPIDVVASDLVGDGQPRLLVTGWTASFLQQWSMLGLKEKQYTLSGLSGLRLTTLP